MGRTPLDVQGQRFGALEVIERAGSSKKGAALWLCKCHRCGETAIIEGCRLREKQDCGCAYREARQDLTGQTIAGLYVIRHTGAYGRGNRMYLCKCLQCGKEAEYPANTIRHGVDSCGCARYPTARMKELSARGVETAVVDGVNVPVALRTEPNRGNKTGLRGVFYSSSRQCYVATCQVRGEKWVRYGYSTPDAAKEARDKKHAELIEKYGVKPI